jgi:dihydrolipoamide dehydrogenase
MVVGEFADAVDLLVLGGGPGGYAAAIRGRPARPPGDARRARRRRRSRRVCLQVGCIPSKALIELADAAQRTRDLHAAGLSVDGVAVSLERFQAWRGRAVRRPRAGRRPAARGRRRARRARRGALQPRRPRRGAHARGPRGLLRVRARDRRHRLAAGRPADLPFDGERVLDSTGALALTAVPDSVVVVGAGYIGLELGTRWPSSAPA